MSDLDIPSFSLFLRSSLTWRATTLFRFSFVHVKENQSRKVLPARCPTEYSRTEENWIQLVQYFLWLDPISLPLLTVHFPANIRLPKKDREQEPDF